MNLVDFKKSLRQLDKIIFFDPNDFLREKSSNIPKLQKMVANAEKLLNETHAKNELYFLYGTLGNLYRIIGKPKKAIRYLNICLDMAKKEGNVRREVVSLIRYGEALKYDHQHLMALEVFNEALQKVKEHQLHLYEDFVLQHKGKCLVELGKLEDAETCFIIALKLRKIKKEVSLINSTEQALDFVDRLKTDSLP